MDRHIRLMCSQHWKPCMFELQGGLKCLLCFFSKVALMSPVTAVRKHNWEGGGRGFPARGFQCHPVLLIQYAHVLQLAREATCGHLRGHTWRPACPCSSRSTWDNGDLLSEAGESSLIIERKIFTLWNEEERDSLCWMVYCCVYLNEKENKKIRENIPII